MSQPQIRDQILENLEKLPAGLQRQVGELVANLVFSAAATADPVAETVDRETRRHPGLLKMAKEGRARLGLPNERGVYSPPPVRMPAGTAARLIAEDRGER